jgi:hypothetical protein
VAARNRQDAKLAMLQVIARRQMNISAHGVDMTPLLHDGMEALVVGAPRRRQRISEGGGRSGHAYKKGIDRVVAARIRTGRQVSHAAS